MADNAQTDRFRELRDQMVRQQIEGRGIRDKRVLTAMRLLPRHEFVPPDQQENAYNDGPLPIGENQTISQPFIVAYMTECLELTGDETVLEIGTGSGYQTALLCLLARQVYSIEIHATLARRAAEILSGLGLRNVEIFVGDGSQGLPDMAPFGAIIAAAAAPEVPIPLLTQLGEGGRLIMPVAEGPAKKHQALIRVRRQGNTWHTERLIPVMFVPLLGRYGFRDSG